MRLKLSHFKSNRPAACALSTRDVMMTAYRDIGANANGIDVGQDLKTRDNPLIWVTINIACQMILAAHNSDKVQHHEAELSGHRDRC